MMDPEMNKNLKFFRIAIWGISKRGTVDQEVVELSNSLMG